MTKDLTERLMLYAREYDPVDDDAREKLCSLLTEAASLIQRLEGERDAWRGDAKHYILRCGEHQEALEAAEQALSASQQEVERLKAERNDAIAALSRMCGDA